MMGVASNERDMVSQVLDNSIYVGSVKAAKDNDLLFGKLGVTHIVNCTQREPCHFEYTAMYYRVPVLDVPRSVMNT